MGKVFSKTNEKINNYSLKEDQILKKHSYSYIHSGKYSLNFQDKDKDYKIKEFEKRKRKTIEGNFSLKNHLKEKNFQNKIYKNIFYSVIKINNNSKNFSLKGNELSICYK
jgi:hypothetical protein